jgi:glucan phosphorylase
MKETGKSFEVALAATRPGNVFTTHTAVPAGFDRFAPELITKYLDLYAQDINIDVRDILALGRQNANDEKEEFNMAYLALRGSGAVNWVSRLHGDVSRGHCQVNGGRFKSDCSCGILHRCPSPPLSITVIASPRRLSVIAFGCIFALP